MANYRSGLLEAESNKVETYYHLAALFRLFSNPTALKILDAIRTKEMTPLAISLGLGIKNQTILRKLRQMEREGIVASRTTFEVTVYRLADSQIVRALDQILRFPEKRLARAGSLKLVVRGRTK